MRSAAFLALTLLLLGTVESAPAQYLNQYRTGGGGAFGGGTSFGNGTTQSFGPYSASPGYGYGGYGGYGLGQPVNPYGYGFPAYGVPHYGVPAYGVPSYGGIVPATPGFFRIGPLNLQYWRAASGYYYPWGIGGTGLGYAPPVYVLNQGQSQPSQQNPPLYTVFQDMQQYLDQSKKEGRVNDTDYQHLFRRLQDLRGKYDHLVAQNGSLDQSDEDSIRKEVGMLGGEIASRIKPLPASTAGGGSDSDARSASRPPTRSSSKSGWVEESK